MSPALLRQGFIVSGYSPTKVCAGWRSGHRPPERHRPAGSPRSAVLAFSDEIDRWLASSPTRLEPHSTGDNGHFSHDATALHLEGLCSKATLGKNRAEAMLKRVEQTRELLVKLTESVRRSRALRTEWQQRA